MILVESESLMNLTTSALSKKASSLNPPATAIASYNLYPSDKSNSPPLITAPKTDTRNCFLL